MTTTAQKLRAQQRAERRGFRQLIAHPDPRDPDYPDTDDDESDE